MEYVGKQFDESLLPYFVDVVVYANLENEALREHIDRVGVRIYVKRGGTF